MTTVIHGADLELAKRALAADPSARARFAERMACVPRMLTVLNARAGRPLGPHDLEDLTQDTWIAVWRGLPTYEGYSSLESWVFRCCHRALLGRLRRPVRWSAKDAVEVPEPSAPQTPERHDEVYPALERLDERSRRVIELKHFEDLTFEEIGERLSTSPNTIKSWYYQAIGELKRILAPTRREGGR